MKPKSTFNNSILKFRKYYGLPLFINFFLILGTVIMSQLTGKLTLNCKSKPSIPDIRKLWLTLKKSISQMVLQILEEPCFLPTRIHTLSPSETKERSINSQQIGL